MAALVGPGPCSQTTPEGRTITLLPPDRINLCLSLRVWAAARILNRGVANRMPCLNTASFSSRPCPPRQMVTFLEITAAESSRILLKISLTAETLRNHQRTDFRETSAAVSRDSKKDLQYFTRISRLAIPFSR